MLTKARRRLQITQTEASKRADALAHGILGISQSAISRWEAGERYPALPQLHVLVEVYGLTDAEVRELLRLSYEDALVRAQAKAEAQRADPAAPKPQDTTPNCEPDDDATQPAPQPQAGGTTNQPRLDVGVDG